MESMSDNSKEDPRKIGLKNGLRQLTIEQLERVINYKGEMVLDSFNYEDGKFCPLAVGVGLDQWDRKWSHETVFGMLHLLGYKVYNTRGIAGEFYTSNRLEDLMAAAREVLEEKQNAKQQ
jgi:hypothetical protein